MTVSGAAPRLPLLRRLLPCLAVSLLTAGPGRGGAQEARSAGLAPIRPVLRVDALIARATALHAGAGTTTALGNYARVDLVAAGGVLLGGGRDARASGRVEAIGRFLFDPFLQFRWAPYAGAGLSARFDRGDGTHTLLVAVVGAEGPPRGGFLPALEVGIGGGVRVGGVLRRARPDRR